MHTYLPTYTYSVRMYGGGIYLRMGWAASYHAEIAVTATFPLRGRREMGYACRDRALARGAYSPGDRLI